MKRFQEGDCDAPLLVLLCFLPVSDGQAQKQRYSVPTQRELKQRARYADLHFAEGSVPGSKTDRGKVSIGLGPPDDVKSFNGPQYPYQSWMYWNIPGIGSDMEIQFLDQHLETWIGVECSTDAGFDIMALSPPTGLREKNVHFLENSALSHDMFKASHEI